MDHRITNDDAEAVTPRWHVGAVIDYPHPYLPDGATRTFAVIGIETGIVIACALGKVRHEGHYLIAAFGEPSCAPFRVPFVEAHARGVPRSDVWTSRVATLGHT